MIILTIGIESLYAIHLFLTIAVLGEEVASQKAILHFNLSAYYFHFRKERLHPVIDRCADYQYFCSIADSLIDGLDAFGAKQMAGRSCELLTKGIEILQSHTLEEMCKHLLFGFPVRI